MKFRSHWPSVTPSVRVLVSSPLHVILSVEAAFASRIVLKPSTKMNASVKRFCIATTTEPVGMVLRYFSGQILKGRFNTYRCLASNDREGNETIRQVAETKRFIAEQRARIEKLKAAGISTVEAEQTLEVLCSSLPRLERYEKYVTEHTS